MEAPPPRDDSSPSPSPLTSSGSERSHQIDLQQSSRAAASPLTRGLLLLLSPRTVGNGLQLLDDVYLTLRGVITWIPSLL